MPQSGGVDTSWYRRKFGSDNDGRMTSVVETALPDGSRGRSIKMAPDQGFGGVYRSMNLNRGAVYHYFYDANGRRRLKMYPTGRSDEFFYDGDRMIEDQGLVSSYDRGGHTYDQYIGLGSIPVAVVKQAFTESGVRQPAATDCIPWRTAHSSSDGVLLLLGLAAATEEQ